MDMGVLERVGGCRERGAVKGGFRDGSHDHGQRRPRGGVERVD